MSAAPTKRPEDITKSPDFLLLVLAFVGLLFLAALAIWFADRWRRKQNRVDDEGFSLTNYRKMLDTGELSPDEYEKIRAKMAGKMKADLGLPAMPPQPPAPPKSE